VQNQELDNIEYAAPALKESIETIEPTPDNPPWNSWAALGVWVASVLFLMVFGGAFLLPYLMKQSLNFADSRAIEEFAKTDATAVLLQVVATIPAHLFTILLGWAVVTRFKKYDFRQTLGWQSGGVRWWHYLLILGLILAISLVVLNFFPEQENDLSRILKTSHAAVYVVAFLATFTAPITEELVYRGILYSAFQRAFGVATAVLIVTAIFAGVHFVQYWGSPSTIFVICLLSLVLTLVRVYSKNLLPCIILHTLINGLQSIGLVAQTFVEQKPEIAPDHASIVHLFNFLFF
jgi:membrane protease YdiL (CAAX protease family)